MIHTELENSLYLMVKELFPDWRVIQAYTNNQEPQTPYLAIDIKRLDELGRENVSNMSDPISPSHGTIQVQQDFAAKVVFELIGKYGETASVSDMAMAITRAMRTPAGHAAQRKFNLSLFKLPSTRRVPMLRETDMYMFYQVTCEFGFSVIETTTQEFAAGADIHGVYYDAGRPGHVIESHIDINFEH
ncbi:hypothetical protein AU075_gp162 [Pseudomonas phage C11]|uniref:hypothetical protein n=1 Tax=Pseudomonas phage C11 TaxID=1735586 RepID=UPI00070575E2|nr:hypothetical protein AU075_gp162 [Pseudomonas phage C11]ALJ97518.1 hypothetical protein C11_058 [Pseudomonas phage C11]